MRNGFLWQAQTPPRLLFKRARRIGHIKATAAIADRQAIAKHVLAKLHCHLRIERLHEPIAKNVAGDDVRMAGTENQIAIGMNARPVEGHEAADRKSTRLNSSHG